MSRCFAAAILLSTLGACTTQSFFVGESRTRTIEIWDQSINVVGAKTTQLLDVINIEVDEFIIAVDKRLIKVTIGPAGLRATDVSEREYCDGGVLLHAEPIYPATNFDSSSNRDVLTITPRISRRIGECKEAADAKVAADARASAEAKAASDARGPNDIQGTAPMPGTTGGPVSGMIMGMSSLSNLYAVAELNLVSTPAGAEVLINGDPIGRTDVKHLYPFQGSKSLAIEWRKTGFIACLRRVGISPTILFYDFKCTLGPIK